MSFSRHFLQSARSLAILALAGVFTIAGQAQTSGQYTKGIGYVPNPLAPYTGRQVAPPNFSNSGRMQSLVRDGKLMLSLNDAIALALENNLDLAIARYNLPIANTDIMRAKSGNSVRGVNTGVVSGTPGGTGSGVTGGAAASGGGAGGTTAAAGGAGTGSAGIVASTSGVGPSIPSFDPFLTSSVQLDRNKNFQTIYSQSGNTASALLLPLQDNSTTANFSYVQGFATGTQLSVGLNNTRSALSPALSAFNPQLSSNFRAVVTQPLLAGFGIGINTRNIRIAKNNREISDVAFRQQVISTVSQIQNIYWDLVSAYEDVKAKERALALAERLLADNRKQVEIGTLAPIEVVRAQSQVAASSQDLIVSQTNLQLQQLLMINAVSRNMSDEALAALPVIPTDTMDLPKVEPVVPVQDLIADALAHRPELAESQIDLTNRQITKKAARNALLPTLNLVGWYGGTGIGGDTPVGSTLTGSGYSDVLGDVFGGTYPDKGIGIQLNIPIRNRSAQADQVRSELEYRQAQMRLQQLQNQIRIDVRNAQFAVQQNRARVEAAIKGRELAQQSLDAEQKKYALGASTTYNVLQMQRDLATAESSLVASKTAYEKSKVALDQSTGLTLTNLGIQIADAESGNVTTMPMVPTVAPRKDVTPTQQQQVPQAELNVATPVAN
jgi:outer membrane protein